MSIGPSWMFSVRAFSLRGMTSSRMASFRRRHASQAVCRAVASSSVRSSISNLPNAAARSFPLRPARVHGVGPAVIAEELDGATVTLHEYRPRRICRFGFVPRGDTSLERVNLPLRGLHAIDKRLESHEGSSGLLEAGTRGFMVGPKHPRALGGG